MSCPGGTPSVPLPSATSHLKSTAESHTDTMDNLKLLRSPEKSARSSFSSVRENDAALLQTFTSSKVSSYAGQTRDTSAIDDDQATDAHNMATITQTQFVPPVTQPQSRLHGSWLPAVAAAGFQGWKQIGVKGRQASRSHSDLRSLHLVWASESDDSPLQSLTLEEPAPGHAPFERLPAEILYAIVDLLVLDVPSNGISARNVDLRSLLLTSKTLHGAALNSLYRNITIPHSKIFNKFLSHVSQNAELGTIVRRMDFSHFNPMSLFSTASERAGTRHLTPDTLLQCLELTPHIQEFLAQEYVDDEISDEVLRKLLFGLPRLRALDLCACSSASFKNAWQSLMTAEWPQTPISIARLSLHRCINILPAAFEALMPRLTNLTHLDVAGTRITDEALGSIPHTARITHLNLAKCKGLSPEFLADFFENHPAVNKSLVYLSLATDARSHQLLTVDDVTQILPVLPGTLRSLSLKGSKMNASHIGLLAPLMEHLEELSLGRGLQVSDMEQLFVAPPPTSEAAESTSSSSSTPNSDLNNNSAASAPAADQQQTLIPRPHMLKYLDLSDYATSELSLEALHGRLMKPRTAPLEVIEVCEAMYPRLVKSPSIEKTGWSPLDFGSRAWLVRRFIPTPAPPTSSLLLSSFSPTTIAPSPSPPMHPVPYAPTYASAPGQPGKPRDSGARSWKMGATYWGMRKVPVAVMEVGGMYGMYMFKKTL